MKLGRPHALGGLIGAALLAAGVWLALNTEWVEIEVPDPVKGPALRDPDLRLKQFATRLGAVVTTPANLDRLPPPGATLLLSSTHWNIFPERAQALRRWVEAGGHLWLPFQGDEASRLDWVPVDWARIEPPKPVVASPGPPASGAARDDDEDDDDEPPAPAPAPAPKTAPSPAATAKPRCPDLAEPPSVAPAFGTHRRFASCLYTRHTLRTRAPLQWALDGPNGHVVARVPLGRGSVTVTSAYMPWSNPMLLESDNALLAAAALRIGPGQALWIVKDETRPPLLSFLWTTGTPAVLLGGLALALALWRGAVRFGPRAAPLPTARRSVAEQIRGTADFVAHHGSAALHTAQLRALADAARPRIRGFDGLIVGERAVALARLTGLDAHALARAMNPELTPAIGRHPSAALALIETARRRLLNSAAAPPTEPR